MSKEILSKEDELVGLVQAYEKMGYSESAAKLKAKNAVLVSRLSVGTATELVSKKD